ncbi:MULTISPECIES: hypothetical protein [unclassified Streptomyces]|nr:MULTISPECIES: hypothetical protein [unclassified Streptomyces]
MAISETNPTTTAVATVAVVAAVEGAEQPVPLRAEPLAGLRTPGGRL